MKTKTIFKTLALAMLMPAMLLTTACSSDDDAITNNEINNNENTAKKGYAIPVTVNVTRQGDATTRATYNGTTNQLSFSSGDQLFVWGSNNTAGSFAGKLKWQSGGTFSGTITTQKEYTGTADDLFSKSDNYAMLLPNGYKTYGFLSAGDGYNSDIEYDYTKAFADSKAAAVEQFSCESTTTYDEGFALEPHNAILNFTITGLTASTGVNVVFTKGYLNIDKTVTTNESGTATFAIGVEDDSDLKYCTLTVGGTAITLGSHELVAGHIYNITRSAAPAARALSEATTDDIGKIAGADGNIYDNATAASDANTTAVAIIAYVGSAGSVDASSASYKGLAIAMSDANSSSTCAWYTDHSGSCVSRSVDIATAITYKNGIECTNTLINSNGTGVTTTCSGHYHAAAIAARNNNGIAAPTGTSDWFLPSLGQWNLIVQGLATKKTGSAVTTNLSESTNSTYYSFNLNSVITDVGGTGFRSALYGSSSEYDAWSSWHMHFAYGSAGYTDKSGGKYVRSVIAF